MAEKAAEMLLDIESNFDKLESLYNSLGDQVIERQQETSEDYDQWTSIHNQLLNHIEDIKNAINEYQQKQMDNIQIQIDNENKKRKEIDDKQKQEINKLQKQIKDLKSTNTPTDKDDIISKNPYKDFNKFLDEIDTLNKNQQKQWDKSKENSQNEIQNALDMLDDPTKWPQFAQQLKDKDEKIKELLNEIECMKTEQHALNTLINSTGSEKDQEIETLRVQLKEQKQINEDNQSEISELNNKISNYDIECNDKNAMIDKLEKEILALNTRMKQENENLKSVQNDNNDTVDRLEQELKDKNKTMKDLEVTNKNLSYYNEEEKLKNIGLNEKMKKLNDENENLKAENEYVNKIVNNLKEEMDALKNEINKSKATNKVINDGNIEDKLMEKYQDILQILYYELQPEHQSLDDVEQIKDAFNKWKQKEKQKYKNRYKNINDMNGNEKNESKYDDWDTQEYVCQKGSFNLSSLFIWLKDF
eukprot:454094_1